MRVSLHLFAAVVCALSCVAGSAQTKTPGTLGFSPTLEGLSRPSEVSRLRSFVLDDQGKAVLELSRRLGDSAIVVGVPRGSADELAFKGQTCFTMRSYLFSQDEDDAPDAVRMTGYTTCVAAGSVHARDAEGGPGK